MKKYLSIIFPLTLVTLIAIANPVPLDLWGLFAKTRFVEKLNRQLSMYFLYPAFPPELKALEGKEVELAGFYIPLEINDTKMIILSKFPMAECFFCGGSGPESVAVVYLREKPSKRLKMDDIITVSGKLILNENDVDELNFILKNAKIISYD
ncbi:hypothetical protein [Lunatibacter salilacus]|uniref:hypothetical protein n=1 Tax=Lunatibacter salilacus TaxID=2483804 RepID=UPI0018FECD24|nr:hypothetical protein [Lunatibacter salilacus]